MEEEAVSGIFDSGEKQTTVVCVRGPLGDWGGGKESRVRPGLPLHVRLNTSSWVLALNVRSQIYPTGQWCCVKPIYG